MVYSSFLFEGKSTRTIGTDGKKLPPNQSINRRVHDTFLLCVTSSIFQSSSNLFYFHQHNGCISWNSGTIRRGKSTRTTGTDGKKLPPKQSINQSKPPKQSQPINQSKPLVYKIKANDKCGGSEMIKWRFQKKNSTKRADNKSETRRKPHRKANVYEGQ